MALLLDTLGWLDPFFRLLVANRDADVLLWPHSVLALLNELALATRVLGIESLNPCRYALRHGGASEDLSSGARTREEVKARGRWKTEASLARYGKSTRLLTELRKVPPATLSFGKWCMDHLQAILQEPKLVLSQVPAGRA